jgi:hypothetical protein
VRKLAISTRCLAKDTDSEHRLNLQVTYTTWWPVAAHSMRLPVTCHLSPRQQLTHSKTVRTALYFEHLRYVDEAEYMRSLFYSEGGSIA